ncbi:unnamed protein product [Ectocarpus sp. 12 AP-2014]
MQPAPFRFSGPIVLALGPTCFCFAINLQLPATVCPPSDVSQGLSFKSPLFFSYPDGTVSQEAVVNGINGLEGTTTNFAFSIG